VYRIGEVILFANKTKNTDIATLWRVFSTQLASKRARLNVYYFITDPKLQVIKIIGSIALIGVFYIKVNFQFI